MPVLKDYAPQVKQFMLPSTANLPQDQQAWVKMDVGGLLAGDIMDMMGGSDDMGAGNISGEMLANRIKEWNFTEADGTPTPISLDTVRRLEVADLSYLFTQFNVNKLGPQLSDPQKKT